MAIMVPSHLGKKVSKKVVNLGIGKLIRVRNDKVGNDILPPTGKKYIYVFCIKSTSILGNGTVFYFFYLEKFGFNIFPDLKSEQLRKNI